MLGILIAQKVLTYPEVNYIWTFNFLYNVPVNLRTTNVDYCQANCKVVPLLWVGVSLLLLC